jgi:3-oxo-5-alpha-steroid 4-dehydrogenase 3
VIESVPDLASRFLKYGARSSNPQRLSNRTHSSWKHVNRQANYGVEKPLRSKDFNNDKRTEKSPSYASRGHLYTLYNGLLDKVELFTVPHAWFKHFYVLSTLSTIFWGYQLWARGWFYRLIATKVSENREAFMMVDQIVMLWFVILLQGSRRLYESIVYAKPSLSTMWIGHWIMGMGFYFFVNIAIWIEAVRKSTPFSKSGASIPTKPLTATLRVVDRIGTIEYPYQHPFRFLVGLIVLLHITFFSIEQNRIHYYLSTLPSGPQYKVPMQRPFKEAICPHYGEEISIYHSLIILAAGYPQQNWTLLFAYAFVYVNLRVTAKGTREWYHQKFGADAVTGKNLMFSDMSQSPLYMLLSAISVSESNSV